VTGIKKDEIESVVRAAQEIGESSEDFRKSMLELRKDANTVRKLWKSQNKSTLIRVGLTLIALPDPGFTDIVGSALLAAGMVQAGIKHGALGMEDIPKALQSAFSEIKNAKDLR
jgi:hypothetical protein